MRFLVKRWGNSPAIRLPTESPELGRLEEGMIVEGRLAVVKEARTWRPLTFDSGIPDLSQRIDEIAWGYLDEKYPGGRNRPPRK